MGRNRTLYLKVFRQTVLGFLSLAIFPFAEASDSRTDVGKVIIVHEGIVPSDLEREEARNTPSLEVLGTPANPIVIASSTVAVYNEENAFSYPFRMFLPKEIDPKMKYPLVLWLHGAGESRNDNESQLMHMQTSIDVLAGPNRPNFYLAAVQCPFETRSWHKPDPRTPHGETPIDMIDKVVRALVRDYPIDPDRISLLGISSGVTAGYELIRQFPDRFSAFAACSSPEPEFAPSTYRRLPIWLFNNRNDRIDALNVVRFADSVNQFGGDAYVTLHEEGGHNTWTSAQRDDHVIEWLIRQKRGRYAFPRHVPALDRPESDVLLMFGLPIAVFLFAVAAEYRIVQNGKLRKGK